MSGLGQLGELGLGFVTGGGQVAQRDIDQYDLIAINNPSVDTAYFGAGTSTGTTVQAIVLKNQVADWPRNAYYNFTGGTAGGTITANYIDQFGNVAQETVSLGSVAAGGSVFGTVIAAKFISGTVTPNTSTQGTYTIGFGTVENGSAASNWFGLLTKLGGTSDVKNIRWTNNGTPTGLNKGTAIGTLVNTTTHSFQGTSGVAITDTYSVIFKPSFDNTSFGTMCNL